MLRVALLLVVRSAAIPCASYCECHSHKNGIKHANVTHKTLIWYLN